MTSVRRMLATLLCGFLLVHNAQATTDSMAHQYKLEAAFIYNFFNYITWPGYHAPDELASATVCVAAGDPVEPYLAYVQQKMTEQRQLVVRRLSADGNAEGCQLFFARHNLPPQLKASSAVLTVTADASSAGMIAMHEVDGRMALTINNTALSEQGFQASSRLLSLAQEVK